MLAYPNVYIIYINIQRADTPPPPPPSTTRARRPLVAVPPSLKKQEKRKSITKAGRMRCSWWQCACLLPLFNISRIVCTQRGATNISLSIFADLSRAGTFYFHSDVIKDRIFIYIAVTDVIIFHLPKRHLARFIVIIRAFIL